MVEYVKFCDKPHPAGDGFSTGLHIPPGCGSSIKHITLHIIFTLILDEDEGCRILGFLSSAAKGSPDVADDGETDGCPIPIFVRDPVHKTYYYREISPDGNPR